MVRVQTYREASRELLNKAREEMAAGDLRQASEKGWGGGSPDIEGYRPATGVGTHRP